MKRILYEQTDFAALIEELVLAGWSNTEIAARVGVKQSSISQLRNRAVIDPRFSLGYRILRLHQDEMQKYHRRELERLEQLQEQENENLGSAAQ